jgi:purine-nucleoside phosphorylase
MLYDQVLEAVSMLRARCAIQPIVGLVLGSGLGDLATEIQDAVAIPYKDIPHFAHSTVVGHAGRLLIGMLEGVPIVAMQGRFHMYEGYSAQTVTFPIRVMRQLGVETFLVSNAAGGVNPAYHPGDFMLIRDHIFLPGMAGLSPLTGVHDERLGARFPPMARAYDADLRTLARDVAQQQGMTLHEGIYTMVTGPSYETAAELRFLRVIGTDAVGMSTLPEVIVACQVGMKVVGVSLITNTATGDETSETTEVNHEEVLAAADAARPRFAALMRGIVRGL